jgi:hypothetical protein
MVKKGLCAERERGVMSHIFPRGPIQISHQQADVGSRGGLTFCPPGEERPHTRVGIDYAAISATAESSVLPTWISQGQNELGVELFTGSEYKGIFRLLDSHTHFESSRNDGKRVRQVGTPKPTRCDDNSPGEDLKMSARPPTCDPESFSRVLIDAFDRTSFLYVEFIRESADVLDPLSQGHTA